MTVSNAEENLLIHLDHDGKKTGSKEITKYTQSKEGLGLKSIKARCMMLNAKIEYSDVAGDPAIVVSIPYNGKRT